MPYYKVYYVVLVKLFNKLPKLQNGNKYNVNQIIDFGDN